MEQLTTYRAQGREIGLVFLFKYDLNGNLKLFEISEGELVPEQIKWLFTGFLPKDAAYENAKELLSHLETNFPATEKIMETVWLKEGKYGKVFEITKSPADLSFDALWDLYGYKESRKEAERLFKKLKEEEIIKCFIQVPKYKKNITQRGIAQALLKSWLFQQRYNDEYAEIVSTKNFNPVIGDLAKLKKI